MKETRTNTELDIRSRPPMLFSVAKWLQRNGVKGGYRIDRLGRQWLWNDGRALRLSSRLRLSLRCR